MDNKKFKVNVVGYGIANRFSNNEIEINRKLLKEKFKPLLNEILEHEKKHTDKFFSVKDFNLDIEGFKNKRLYRIFVLTTPSSWLQFFPIYYTRKKIYFDFNLTLVWIFSIFTAILVSRYLITWMQI